MARSENQGIQIALIVFAFMFILATVGFIYYINENSKNVATAAAAETKAADAEARSREIQDKWNLLCASSGVSPDADSAQLTALFSKEGEYAKIADPLSDDPGGDSSTPPPPLMDTVNALNRALAKKARDVEDNNKKLDALEAKIADMQAQHTKEKDDINAAFAAASAAHQQAITNAQETETGLKTQVTTLQASLRELTGERDTLKTELANAQTAFQQELDKVNDQLDQVTKELVALRNESFTSPDGRIRLVDQRAETVWINLGSADNLRPQITFSVWPRDANGLARDGQSRKGAIEILRVDGPHSAEARITQQDPLDPIVPGDFISTPLWRPGELLGFALVGSLDIDGDAISDRERIVQLIQSNGGTVDAEMNAEGTMDGEMTVDTRYIIVGKSPTGKEVEVSTVLTKADRLGIQRISLADFLERSGYRKNRESKSFGAGSDPEDFDDVPVDNNRFRPRRPPSGIGN